jgi:hypothetical protein
MMPSWKCVRDLPIRHRVMLMCLLGSMLCYASRFVLAVAIIEISNEFKYSKAEQVSTQTHIPEPTYPDPQTHIPI